MGLYYHLSTLGTLFEAREERERERSQCRIYRNSRHIPATRRTTRVYDLHNVRFLWECSQAQDRVCMRKITLDALASPRPYPILHLLLLLLLPIRSPSLALALATTLGEAHTPRVGKPIGITTPLNVREQCSRPGDAFPPEFSTRILLSLYGVSPHLSLETPPRIVRTLTRRDTRITCQQKATI